MTSTNNQIGKKNSPAFAGMGENNLQLVDIAGNKRIQVGVQRPTSAVSQVSDSGDKPSVKGNLRGGAKLLDKDTIEDRFYLRLFLVPEKDGKMSPVINLWLLNQFLVHNHFKMEGMHVVRNLLQKNDWMIRIDLEDAYFLIPIDPQHQSFLWFKRQKRAWADQFTCLPFGLSSAPRVFTKISSIQL